MTTTELPQPEELEDTFKVIDDHCERIYTWKYERSRPQLVTLYNKAAQSQWASVTDLDWSTDVDPESLVDLEAGNMRLMREVTKAPGSPIASWTDKELLQLGIEMFTAMLSQFMHGEQGAMLTAAKIVETVPWIDAKYYAATQTMDEARHTEVFARYIDEKVGEPYPMNPNLEAQITGLLEDSRWDIAYLGMQIVIESLALAAFGDMARQDHRAVAEKAPPLRHGRRGPPRRLRHPLPRRVLPEPLRRRAEGPAGLLARAHRQRTARGRRRRRSGSGWASTRKRSSRSSSRRPAR